jgi:hypothetical protein
MERSALFLIGKRVAQLLLFVRDCLLVHVVFLTASRHWLCAQTASPFQCQPTSDQSGDVYTPNIPDFYFNDMNAADFRAINLTTASGRDTYIFTLPAQSAERSCTGNVVAIQYCYQARASDINIRSDVFNFLHMTRNGLAFTVTGSFRERTTPRESFCTDPSGSIQRICCETTNLSVSNQFQIPSTTYTFAVMNININILPLTFVASTTDYRYEQLQEALGNSAPPAGNIITLGQHSAVSDQSLLLMRFILGKTITL